MKIEKNFHLADISYYKIGGNASYFCEARTIEDIKQAISFAVDNKLSIIPIGATSNILFRDEGVDGLVVKVNNQILEIIGSAQNNEMFHVKHSRVRIGAGVPLSRCAIFAKENGLTGFEWMLGIPGTVGGAIFGNAGAFGNDISKTCNSVTVFSFPQGYPQSASESLPKIFSNFQCSFGYRTSLFKTTLKNAIIWDAEFTLTTGNPVEIQTTMDQYFSRRKTTQPFGQPSLGSTFKNIPLTHELLVKFDFDQFKEKGIIPVAYLIAACGFKGKKIGGAQVSDKNPNFIVNVGNAKAIDVLMLISLIKTKIRVTYGILLEEEIRII